MKRFLVVVVLAFALVLGISSCIPRTSGGGDGDVVVASKDFTEQNILGELVAQQIEESTNLKVGRRFHLGGSFVCHQALLAGKIDTYVEYTGTAFSAILKQKPISDPKEVYKRVKQAYAEEFNLEVMDSLGFENTYATIIRGEDAKRFNIQTISDTAQYTPKWRAGFGYEFMEREDGYAGFKKAYGLTFAKRPQIMDLGLIYRALYENHVDMVMGNSTDGQIARLGMVILKDDKQYFPPYEGVPIIRQETLNKYPELKEAIAPLIGLISADEMQQLNYLVEGELRKIKNVVREFRKAKGLTS
jgi:osmoprotectant transport system substrate-binding protein